MRDTETRHRPLLPPRAWHRGIPSPLPPPPPPLLPDFGPASLALGLRLTSDACRLHVTGGQVGVIQVGVIWDKELFKYYSRGVVQSLSWHAD
jgi:hypothetical protein